MVDETGLDKPKVDEDEIAVDEPGPHHHKFAKSA